MHKFGAISIVWMVWECGMAEMGGILRYATDFQGTGKRHGSRWIFLPDTKIYRDRQKGVTIC